MGWHIHVYPIAMKTQFHAIADEEARYELLENAAAMPKFTPEQKEMIRSHLAYRGYVETNRPGCYEHKEEPTVEAMLTDEGLYFTARSSGIMEISMTGSEFGSMYNSMKGNFTVFDPQNLTWEPKE